MSKMRSNSVRVAMYSPDSVGLGHVRRLSAIAEELTRVRKDVTTLIMAGCAAGSYFSLPEGADFIKLPSLEKIGSNKWKPRSLQIPQETMCNLRTGLVREAIMAFQPDILLVDHNPAGLDNELIPSLEAIQQSRMECEVVLGMRDILGAPADICKQWQAAGIYGLLQEHYNRILVYGSQEIFPAAELYGLGGQLAERVSYCGYVYDANRVSSQDRDGRTPFNKSGSLRLVVTAGGGYDAYEMMSHVVQSAKAFRRHIDVDMLMIAGPLMPEGKYASLSEICSSTSVRLERSRFDLARCVDEADLIITMGGYNTLMEAIGLNKRTIVIPRVGPSAEQMIRAKLFEKLGLVTVHLQQENSPADLARLVAEKLAEPERACCSFNFLGLETAARRLLDRIPAIRTDQQFWKAEPFGRSRRVIC